MTPQDDNQPPIHEHVPLRFSPPPANASVLTLYLASALMFVLSLVCAGLGLSYIYCPAYISWIAPLCADEHYKYLVPLLIPTTAWFAIANWVGWEYFRYA